MLCTVNHSVLFVISCSKEGVLSVVTKTLVKKVPGLNAYSQSNENIHENLEDSMKKVRL